MVLTFCVFNIHHRMDDVNVKWQQSASSPSLSGVQWRTTRPGFYPTWNILSKLSYHKWEEWISIQNCIFSTCALFYWYITRLIWHNISVPVFHWRNIDFRYLYSYINHETQIATSSLQSLTALLRIASCSIKSSHSVSNNSTVNCVHICNIKSDCLVKSMFCLWSESNVWVRGQSSCHANWHVSGLVSTQVATKRLY